MKKIKLLFFIFVTFGIFMFLGNTTVNAAEIGNNGKMYWETNKSNSAYNIKGYVGNTIYKTTFDDTGYCMILKSGENLFYPIKLQNGVEQIYKLNTQEATDAIGLTITPTFVNNGNYVKVKYTVRNILNEVQTISIGTYSDSQIGNNDSAALRILNNSIIEMSDDESAQFNLVTNNSYGVTDVSTKWIGEYFYAEDNAFVNTDISELTNIDSGLSFSWKDVSFAANETKSFSVLFGVGRINNAPSITISEVTQNEDLGDNVFTVKGTVSDKENTNNTEIYYTVDGENSTLMHTFTGVPGDFEVNLTLSETDALKGLNELSFYAQDEDGAISNLINKTITYPTHQAIVEETSNIKIEGKIMKSVSLFVEKQDENKAEEIFNTNFNIKVLSGDETIIGFFDVSLVNENGVKVSANGEKLKITFPLDEKYNGKTIRIIHYIESENKTEEFTTVAKNGEVTIEVTSLSPFLLLEANLKGKDETPKTGNNSMINLILMIEGISLASMFVLRKKIF